MDNSGVIIFICGYIGGLILWWFVALCSYGFWWKLLVLVFFKNENSKIMVYEQLMMIIFFIIWSWLNHGTFEIKMKCWTRLRFYEGICEKINMHVQGS